MAIHRPVGPSGPFRGWKGRRAGRKGRGRLRKKQKRDGDLFEVCPPGEEECQDGGHGIGRRGGAARRFFRVDIDINLFLCQAGKEGKGKESGTLYYFTFIFFLPISGSIDMWPGRAGNGYRYGMARHATARHGMDMDNRGASEYGQTWEFHP